MKGNSLGKNKLWDMLHYEVVREEKYQPIFSMQPEDKNAITLEERDRIVAHLLTLNKQFGFHPESYALAVNILDRFLYLVKAQKKYLSCIGVACYFLAMKVVEEEEDLPGASDFLDAIGCSFSVSDLLRMERIILTKLSWDLNSVTPLSFLQVFHALIVTNGCVNSYPASQHLKLLTNKLELLICQNEFLQYRPSTLALALLIQDLNSSLKQWIHLVQWFQTEIKVAEWELNACFVAVSNFLQFACSNQELSEDVAEKVILGAKNQVFTYQTNAYICTSPLIRALALETACSFESDGKIPTYDAESLRLLAAVA